MKYHREANADIKPKRTVLQELKRVEQYSGIFSRNLKPSFFKNLKTLQEIDKKYNDILHL